MQKHKIHPLGAFFLDLLIVGLGIAIAAFLTPGCAPKTIPISTERIYSDTTIIRETQVPVFIPGKTVEVKNLNLDSLLQVAKSSRWNSNGTQTITRVDPKTGQTLQLIIDHLGNLTAICETQDQTIQILKREVDRLRSEITNTTVKEKKRFLEKVKNSLGQIALVLVCIIVALFFIFRGLR
jgi:hypothetical protein